MKRKLLVFLIVMMVSFGVIYSFAADRPSSSRVIAYYFHGTSRCASCYKLEKYSREAVETNFKEAVVAGKLEFRVINVEDKGKEYYADYYQLYTKTLILSLVKDGREVKWKNLNKIWEYVDNKEGFLVYANGEIADLLKEVK